MMKKGALLYTSLLAVVICQALPRNGNSNHQGDVRGRSLDCKKRITYFGVDLINPRCNFDEIIQSNVSDIVTSSETHFGEFPWQAILLFSNVTFRCGASIIGDRWLLTAAHCVDGFNADDFIVRVGEWQINSSDEPSRHVDAPVADIIVHPKFNPINVHNDIAIIELTWALSPEENINSICLPASGQKLSGQRCISTGWGRASFIGPYQTMMKKVELPLVAQQQCQKLLRKTQLGNNFILDDSFICAGGEENEDACQGDGGGPLACQDPTTGRYILTGITSWGVSCGAKDVPGVYVDVQEYVPWVDTVLSSKHSARIYMKCNMDTTEKEQIAFPQK